MEKTDKRFIYNDLLERNKRMNRLYLPTSFLLLSLLLLYLWMKVSVQTTMDITYGYSIFNTVLILVFSVVNLIIYRRQKTGTMLCKLVLLEMAVEILIIGVKTDADFIFIIMLGVLIMFLPYYLPKVFRNYAILYAAVAVIIAVARMAIHPENATVDDFMKTLCVVAAFL